MTFALDQTPDLDPETDGPAGVQIHVNITAVPSAPPGDGLATTGGELPALLTAAAVMLIVAGAAMLRLRTRRAA